MDGSPWRMLAAWQGTEQTLARTAKRGHRCADRDWGVAAGGAFGGRGRVGWPDVWEARGLLLRWLPAKSLKSFTGPCWPLMRCGRAAPQIKE